MAMAPSTEGATDCYSLVPLTRHFPYHGDKLSRLAPPSELIERRPPYEIRSLAEGSTLGAHFAEAMGVQLNLLVKRAPEVL